MFEHTIPSDLHGQAVEEMLELLEGHFAEYPEDRITGQIPPEGTWPKNEVIMRYDSAKTFGWTIVDLRPQPRSA